MNFAGAALPDGEALLRRLEQLRQEGLSLDTFQLTSAMLLLSSALASPEGSYARRRFWPELLLVLATSEETRARLERELKTLADAPQRRPEAPPSAPRSAAPRPRPPASPSRFGRRRPGAIILGGGVAAVGLAALLITWPPPAVQPMPPPPPAAAPPKASEMVATRRRVFDYVSQVRTEIRPDPRLLAAARTGLLLAVVAALAALAYRLHRRRRALLAAHPEDRTATAADPFLSPLGAAVEDLFVQTDITTAARKMRTPILVPTHQLDVGRSVSRTVRRAGVFSPVRRARRQQPEYLAMIERRSAGDHLAQLYELMVGRLLREGVNVRTLFYRVDPQQLVETTLDEGGARVHDLRELSAHAYAQRILVFGATDAFLHPFTGEPLSWVNNFEVWPERAILDPTVRDGPRAGEVLWGPGDARLGQAGWLLGGGRLPVARQSEAAQPADPPTSLEALVERLAVPGRTPFLVGEVAPPPAPPRGRSPDPAV